MAKRVALVAFFLSTLAIAVAYGSAFLPGGAPPWAAWLLAFGTAAVLVAAMMLGAVRNGRIGRLALPFAAVFALLAGGFGLLLALPATDPADPALWFGLPPRAAILLYGIGLLPMFVVPVAYAVTFDEMTLSDGDLERIRDAATQRRRDAEMGVPTFASGEGGEG